MADAIFISYRRDDAEGEAGRLFDDLTRAFGNDAVFMDVAGIKPGVDFRRAIEDNVASCGVLLAVVGPSWASVTGADGKRRLEDPNDFVALEIASAMQRDVPVIPVLVHEAKMPAANLLPDSLKNFSYRNSVELSHARWNSDVQLLVEALKSYVKPAKTATLEPVHATVPVQLPAPHPSADTPAASGSGSGLQVKAGISFAVVVAIAVAVFVAMHKTAPAPAAAPASARAATPGTSPTPATGTATAAPTQAAAPVAAAGVPSGFTGTWVQAADRAGNSLNKLVITTSGSTLMVQAFGGCQPVACDWGIQPAQLDANQNAVATFTPQAVGLGTGVTRVAKVTAHPVGNTLDVLVQNTFNTADGAKTTQNHLSFSSSQ